MGEKTLSVIVPTYNMEKYLRRCLDSLCIPEILEDVEAIVVNDGSCDSSLAIAREYSQACPGCVRVMDKPNGHYGSCVNAGLRMAAGKYVTVLDADDWFDTKGITALIKLLKDASEDMVIHDIRMVDRNGDHLRSIGCPLDEGKTYGVEALCQVPELWGHMAVYRTGLLTGMGYHQTEGIHYTDQEWIFFPVSAVRTLRYLPETVYDYTIGRPGQSIAPDVFWRHIDHEITGVKNQIAQYSRISFARDEVRDYLLLRLRTRMGTVYSQLLVYHLDKESVRKAAEFDSWLHGISQELWDMASGLEAPIAVLRIRFVKRWRASACRPTLLLKALHAFKMLRKTLMKAADRA